VSRISLACAAAALLLVGACGNEGSHDRTRGDAQQMRGEVPDERIADVEDVDQPITVVLTEFSVQLDRDTIPPGVVRFRVRNNGAEEHALVVEGMGHRLSTDLIDPGEWAVLDADLDPGEYDVYCPVESPLGDHAGQGMTARLTVLEPRTPGP
jgi:uncharacterized cupredoxin-like copper-binding protein